MYYGPFKWEGASPAKTTPGDNSQDNNEIKSPGGLKMNEVFQIVKIVDDGEPNGPRVNEFEIVAPRENMYKDVSEVDALPVYGSYEEATEKLKRLNFSFGRYRVIKLELIKPKKDVYKMWVIRENILLLNFNKWIDIDCSARNKTEAIKLLEKFKLRYPSREFVLLLQTEEVF